MAHDVAKARSIFYNGRSRSQVLKNVYVITRELHHNLLVADVDRKQTKKTEWNPEGRKRNVAKLRDEPSDSFLNVGLEILCPATIVIYGFF